MGPGGQQRATRGFRDEPLPAPGGEPQAQAGAGEAEGGERDPFKSKRLLREQAAVKKAEFEFIDEHRGEFSARAMCRVLGVTR